MYQGFPSSHLQLLCCPIDGGALVCDSPREVVRSAEVRCDCGFSTRIEDGILSLEATPSHGESERERVLRDDEYASKFHEQMSEWDLMEVKPVLTALELGLDDYLLELGAGAGRYTLPLSKSCRGLVAVDFSRVGLLRIAERLPDDSVVSLVWADAGTLRPAPGAFSVALSTLTSNLPTTELRAAMFRVAATAVQSGRFVFLAHHWGAMARFRGLARDGYYPGRAIFRHFMTASEIRREAGVAFQVVETRPIRVIAPGTKRLGLPPIQTSAWLEHIPLVRRLGDLLLGVAQGSIVPEEPYRRTSRPETQAQQRSASVDSPTHCSSTPCPSVPVPHLQP